MFHVKDAATAFLVADLSVRTEKKLVADCSRYMQRRAAKLVAQGAKVRPLRSITSPDAAGQAYAILCAMCTSCPRRNDCKAPLA